MSDADLLHRFLFDRYPIRGHFVRLESSWRAAIEHQHYPTILRDTLGESMAAVALLAGSMKVKGELSLQLQGPGPVRLLLAQVQDQQALRGVARHEGDVLPASVAQMFGGGQLAVTLDIEGRDERHQGLTAIDQPRLATCLEDYFIRSEQVPTCLVLAADGERAAGLLLQRLGTGSAGAAGAQQSEEAEEAWQRISLIARTLSPQEMLTLPFRSVLHRLFHEDDLRVFDPEPMFFRCRCSQDRVQNILRSLGAAEAHALLEEQGQVEICCEFCNRHWQFDAVDVTAIFAGEAAPAAPRRLH